VNALRRRDCIPAVLYGHGVPSVSLEMLAVPFQKVWEAAGESSLIDIVVGDAAPVKAIIQDVQYDPANGKILHVDFHQVRMEEKISVDVVLRYEGESPAVKELGGTLVKERDTLPVECLPRDLVKEIVVDISSLRTFEDRIRMRDLHLPSGLRCTVNLDDIVVFVEPPRTEAELAELDTAVEEDVTKVEAVEKPKEHEEPATPEGETPAPPSKES
jgi:large subunit ribosomal protein L25